MAVAMLGLLFLQFRSLTEALIVLVSVPFALVGSFWTLFLLHYPLSAPVWVGLLSTVGLAMQTGVVMVVYIDEAFHRRVREGRIRDREDIIAAHAEGTVQRLRPKIMTITTMAAGLLPLLWAEGAGAEIMRRVAAPMIGGLATSAFLTLEVLPVLYTLWRQHQLRRARRLASRSRPWWAPCPPGRGPDMRWRRAAMTASLVLLLSLGAPRRAQAQPAALALYVEGPDADAVRSAVVEALPPGTNLADEKVFHAELVREGQNRPLGRDLESGGDRPGAQGCSHHGSVRGAGRSRSSNQTARRALLLVVPAWRTPASAEEVTLVFASREEDAAAIASALGPSLDAYAPPPARSLEGAPTAHPSPSPEADLAQTPSPPASAAPRIPPVAEVLPSSPGRPAPDADARATPRPRTPAQRAAASVIDLALAGEVVGRHFDYDNGVQPSRSQYTAFPAPAVNVRGQLFPLAHTGLLLGDVGLVAGYERIASAAGETGSLAADASPSSYAAGLRVRIHPGSDPRLIVGVSVEYTCTSRRAVGSPTSELPDVTYRSVSPALDTRVSFGRVSLKSDFAFRDVVDRGAISTRFYGPHGFGLDAEFGAALALTEALEARLAVDYELYSFAFTPPPGGAFGVGSARISSTARASASRSFSRATIDGSHPRC